MTADVLRVGVAASSETKIEGHAVTLVLWKAEVA